MLDQEPSEPRPITLPEHVDTTLETARHPRNQRPVECLAVEAVLSQSGLECAISTLDWDGGGVIVVESLLQNAGTQAWVDRCRRVLEADPVFASAWRIRPLVFGSAPGIHRLWLWQRSREDEHESLGANTG